MMKVNRKKKIYIIFMIIVVIILFLRYQNNHIVTTEIDINTEKLPEAFIGFKILHISDLHSKRFGKNQKHLIDKIRDANPDIVVVTGDTVDSRRYNEEPSIELFSQILVDTPVYFVTGNHEARSNNMLEYELRLKEIGVIVLRNESRFLKKEDSAILLIGLDDPSFGKFHTETISNIIGMKNNPFYTVLLSHRPELMDLYIDQNIDLVFSGHAHGGQIRFPFIGGLVSPNQGILPKYTSGIYSNNNIDMVVSRGLGNSIFPQRLFNLPEIILVTLNNTN